MDGWMEGGGAGLEVARYHAVAAHSNTPGAAAGVVAAAAAEPAAAAAAEYSEMFAEDRQSRTGLSRAYERHGRNGKK